MESRGPQTRNVWPDYHHYCESFRNHWWNFSQCCHTSSSSPIMQVSRWAGEQVSRRWLEDDEEEEKEKEEGGHTSSIRELVPDPLEWWILSDIVKMLTRCIPFVSSLNRAAVFIIVFVGELYRRLVNARRQETTVIIVNILLLSLFLLFSFPSLSFPSSLSSSPSSSSFFSRCVSSFKYVSLLVFEVSFPSFFFASFWVVFFFIRASIYPAD